MKQPLPLLVAYVLFSATVLWFGIQNISGIRSASRMDFEHWRNNVEIHLDERLTLLQSMLINPEAASKEPITTRPIHISLLLYGEATPYQYRFTLPSFQPLPELREGTQRTASIKQLHKEVSRRLRVLQRCKRLVRLIEEGPFFDTPSSTTVDYTLVIDDKDFHFERSFSQSVLQEQPPALLLATLLSQYTEATPLHPTLAQNAPDQVQ